MRFVGLIVLFGIGVHILTVVATTHWGADSRVVHLLPTLLSSSVIGGLFLFAEKQIRERLWKLAYPELDLDGTWSGGTSYNIRYIPADTPMNPFQEFERPNKVLLRQNCHHIVVSSTAAPGDSGHWSSLTADLVIEPNGPTVRYAYQVVYGPSSGLFPPEAIGYETLSVLNPVDGTRPVQLRGSFYHCARGQRPVYSGSVAFTRESKEIPSSGWRRFCLWLGRLIANYCKPSVG
jgi:hypothetical protein